QGGGSSWWQGKGRATTVKFGPHGNWHGHPDKLAIEFFGNKDYLVQDMMIGSGYAWPMHRQWFTTTLAHNTVVLDGKNQPFTRCFDRPEDDLAETGRLHARLFGAAVNACAVSAGFAYPGVSCRRTVFQTGEYLLDLFECDSADGKEHVFDWICHSEGIAESQLPFARRDIGFCEDGYDLIRRAEAVECDDNWQIDFLSCKYMDSEYTITGKALRLYMLGEPGTIVYSALCPAAERDKYSPVVIVRRKTTKTVFMALYAPECIALELECLHAADGAIVCQVSREQKFVDVLARQETSKPLTVPAAIETDGVLGYVRRSPSGEVLAAEAAEGSIGF
ncbi:MAG: heparinase II/III domain-containing protein, partial [Alphaproteobacteria bacterium]